MVMIIHTKFNFGDAVRIDDGDIVGRITTISVAGETEGVNYEVTYFHNGEAKTAWCRDWRLNREGVLT